MIANEEAVVGNGETTPGKRGGNGSRGADDLRAKYLFSATRPVAARGKGRVYPWYPGRPDVALRVVSDVAAALRATLAWVFAPKKEGRWQPES